MKCHEDEIFHKVIYDPPTVKHEKAILTALEYLACPVGIKYPFLGKCMLPPLVDLI